MIIASYELNRQKYLVVVQNNIKTATELTSMFRSLVSWFNSADAITQRKGWTGDELESLQTHIASVENLLRPNIFADPSERDKKDDWVVHHTDTTRVQKIYTNQIIPLLTRIDQRLNIGEDDDKSYTKLFRSWAPTTQAYAKLPVDLGSLTALEKAQAGSIQEEVRRTLLDIQRLYTQRDAANQQTQREGEQLRLSFQNDVNKLEQQRIAAMAEAREKQVRANVALLDNVLLAKQLAEKQKQQQPQPSKIRTIVKYVTNTAMSALQVVIPGKQQTKAVNKPTSVSQPTQTSPSSPASMPGNKPIPDPVSQIIQRPLVQYDVFHLQLVHDMQWAIPS